MSAKKNPALTALNDKIARLATRTAKWRDEVQLCLIGCAQFAFDDHNGDPATRLVNALDGADAKALIKWIEGHMPLLWREGEDGARRFVGNKSFVGEYDATVLMSEPWWKLAPTAQQTRSPSDTLALVRGVIARIEKEAAAGKSPAHIEMLSDLKALCGRYDMATMDAAK